MSGQNGGGAYVVTNTANVNPSYNGAYPIAIKQKISERDFSFVELQVHLGPLTGEDRTIRVTGYAKRNPIDKPNKELADALALSRAFYGVQKRLERRAAGLLKQQDDMLAAKEALEAPKPKKKKRLF